MWGFQRWEGQGLRGENITIPSAEVTCGGWHDAVLLSMTAVAGRRLISCADIRNWRELVPCVGVILADLIATPDIRSVRT